ncbi:MAG: hypothetical protein MEQ07_05135 [Aquimonas sp.]|nr:hypothetical protein [Aquimonas sp.]
MADNILTSAEIKRHGLAVIEDRLALGPVHLMKRNRRAAVVLSEAEYERLLQAQPKAVPGQGALQWLLTQAPQGKRSRAQIDAELEAGRDW